jgi:hypothetical protein
MFLSFYLFSRVSIGFILIYILFFAVKNYRSIKHTEFIYKQKSTMLKTYFSFLDSIKDTAYKNEITRIIGGQIFEIHQTGYIKENNDKDGIENTVSLESLASIIREIKK